MTIFANCSASTSSSDEESSESEELDSGMEREDDGRLRTKIKQLL